MEALIALAKGLFSGLGGILKLFGLIFSNPIFLVLVGLPILFGLLFFLKRWSDVAARIVNFVLFVLEKIWENEKARTVLIWLIVILAVLGVVYGIWDSGRRYERRIGEAENLKIENAQLRRTISNLEQTATLTRMTEETVAMATAETKELLGAHLKSIKTVTPYDPGAIEFYNRVLRPKQPRQR